MNREVIKPQPDIPIVVRLDKGPEGLEREGRYGVDYQYTVNGDRGVMWLPREARDQLVRCGAQAGDDVQIVKSMRGRAAVWSVQVVPDSNDPAPPAANQRTNGYVNGHSNGNGNGSGQAQPAAKPQRPAAQWMVAALCAAIDASLAAAAYAKERGLELNFNEEDIRSIAATMYIQASKEGRI